MSIGFEIGEGMFDSKELHIVDDVITAATVLLIVAVVLFEDAEHVAVFVHIDCCTEEERGCGEGMSEDGRTFLSHDALFGIGGGDEIFEWFVGGDLSDEFGKKLFAEG